VIFVLLTQRLEPDKWRCLTSKKKNIGSGGVPMWILYEWTLSYRKIQPNRQNNCGLSVDLLAELRLATSLLWLRDWLWICLFGLGSHWPGNFHGPRKIQPIKGGWKASALFAENIGWIQKMGQTYREEVTGGVDLV